MDFKEIKRLIALVEKANITGFKIETNGMKVEIEKSSEKVIISSIATPPPETQKASSTSIENKEDSPLDASLTPIKSPMVGTVYFSPNPESSPYVSEGDRVKKGQIICIIEAMKLFNEIESEHDGIIEKILLPTASTVQFDQDIFLIRKE